MSQSSVDGVTAARCGVIRGSFSVTGAGKAQAGFTVYRIKFKVGDDS